MTVTVRLFAAAAEAAGADERTIGAGPLSDVLEAVGAAARPGPLGVGARAVLGAGRRSAGVRLRRSRRVPPGSTVDVLPPPFAGG